MTRQENAQAAGDGLGESALVQRGSASLPLTAERLRELLHYDADTGIFRWRVASSKRVKVGSVVGHQKGDGYRLIAVDGRSYRASRLAWLYVHGRWPADRVDHINGTRDDDRIANLRECSQAENLQNMRAKGGSSRFHGVHWYAKAAKWHAQIRVSGKLHHLGYFLIEEDARDAYLAAKARLHTFCPVPRDLVAPQPRQQLSLLGAA